MANKHINVRMGANIGEYQRKMRQAQGSMGKFKGGVMAAGAAIAAASATITAFGTSAIRSAAKMEKFTTSFKIMTGSLREGEKVMRELTEFTAKTPFRLEDVVPAARQIVAATGSVKGLRGELKILGDLASVTGVPLRDMAQIYTKAFNKGKLQAEELNQLAERGIPIIRELADMFGVAEKEIFKMGEKGLITFKDMRQAFVNMTSKGGIAFNAMIEQSKTLEGSFSTLQDTTEIAMARIGKAISDALNLPTQLSQLATMIEHFTKAETAADKLADRITELKKKRDRLIEQTKARGRNVFNEFLWEDLAKVNEELKELERLQKISNRPSFDGSDFKKTDGSATNPSEMAQLREEYAKTLSITEKMPVRGIQIIERETPRVLKESNIELERMNDQMKKLEATTGDWISSLGSGLTGLSNTFSNWSSNQLAIHDQNYREQIDQVNRRFDGEEERLAQMDANSRASASFRMSLDSRRTAELTALEEEAAAERKELLKKQDNMNKLSAVFNAQIAGAMAVIQALNMAPPASFIFAGIAAGIASTQTAAILATPAPAYQIGTNYHPGGPARLHHNEEIVLPEGTKVNTAHKSSGSGMAFEVEHRYRGGDLYMNYREAGKKYGRKTGIFI